jgi:hypothetical protein
VKGNPITFERFVLFARQKIEKYLSFSSESCFISSSVGKCLKGGALPQSLQEWEESFA